MSDFIPIPAGVGYVGCKTDADCFTAMKATDAKVKATICCSYVGIDKLSTEVGTLLNGMAKDLSVSIKEGSNTKTCVQDYQKLPALAAK